MPVLMAAGHHRNAHKGLGYGLFLLNDKVVLSVEMETARISVNISTKVEPPTVALEVSL